MQSSSNAARAAATLLLLGRSGVNGLSLKELSEEIGDAKPAMLRCLSALIEYGFAEQVSRGRYRLGPSIYSLARSESAVNVEVATWRSSLVEIAESFGQTVYLVRRAGLDVVVVDMQVGTSPVQALTSGIGGRLPMGIGAGSVAILGTLDPANRTDIILRNAPKYARWKLGAERITSHVEQAAARGYASDIGLFIPECGGLAVPIRERGHYEAGMSLTLSAPNSFFEMHQPSVVAAKIKQIIQHVQKGQNAPR